MSFAPALRARRTPKTFRPLLNDRVAGSAKLEPRSLAAPLFFFNNLPTGPGGPNQVVASATGSMDITAVGGATNSGIVVGTVGPFLGVPATSFTQSGMVTSQIQDSETQNNGTAAISMIAGQTHQFSNNANPVGFGSQTDLVTTATGNRNYLLSDDGLHSPLGGPVTLVETLTITYTTTATNNAAGNIMVVGGIGFNGVGFSVAAPLAAAPVLVATGATSTVTRSVTPLAGGFQEVVTATTPYAALPTFPGGVGVNIGYTSMLDTRMNGGGTTAWTGQTSIGINYGAHFA